MAMVRDITPEDHCGERPGPSHIPRTVGVASLALSLLEPKLEVPKKTSGARLRSTMAPVGPRTGDAIFSNVERVVS